MFEKKHRLLLPCLLLGFFPNNTNFDFAAESAPQPEIVFDHIHTYQEVVDYLNAVRAYYPMLTELHTIGKSYLGEDLLVLEITNKEAGEGATKPPAARDRPGPGPGRPVNQSSSIPTDAPS